MDNMFTRSWEITKLSFNVIKEDKELMLFPILGGFFSLLFIVAMLFPMIITSITNGIVTTPIASAFMYSIFFILYLGLAFIATFFNVCMVYTAKERFSGKNATFSQSIQFAFSRIHLIFIWSLIAATVGLILRMLDSIAERMGTVGEIIMKIVISLLGAAWSIITIFVVPSMVYYNLGPIDAIKKSVGTLKKTWGENLIKAIGLGLMQFIAILVGIILTILCLILALPAGIIAIGTVIFVAVIYFIFIVALFQAANNVFNTALFVYADSGKVPKGFSDKTLQHAFGKRN